MINNRRNTSNMISNIIFRCKVTITSHIIRYDVLLDRRFIVKWKKKMLRSSQLISSPIKDSLKEITTTLHWIWCA